MIAFFPEIYPDELLYSQLARYSLMSGYTAYIYAAQDLYENKSIRPDAEFLNTFTEDAISAITKNISMRDIVMQHTMFPFYGRFMESGRRKRAYSALLNMSGDYHNLLAIPKGAKPRFLRFCPECVKSDREKYGETYWHRLHQMADIDFCCVHNCRLIDSNISISGKASPSLVTAEETVVMEYKTEILENETEQRLNAYIYEVLEHDIDLENDARAGDYIALRIHNTRYMEGKLRNMRMLTDDYNCFYGAETELWRLQKALTNKDFKIKNICMLAMFLNIAPSDLCSLIIEGETFNSRRKANFRNKKSVSKIKDWKKIDVQNLPRVRLAIDVLIKSERPQRVTFYRIEKMLALPSKQLCRMPKCKAEILKYYENQQQYWARKLSWAVNKIDLENIPLNQKNIRKLTNMRKENIYSSVPYLKKGVYNRIKDIL